ncbi:MAG: PilZ domain-containing protein [Candidatus Bathyarchaeia archaeon]
MEYESVRRTPRYSLIVDIEITDVLLEIQIRARTKMLSTFGCGVDTLKLFPKGTSVRIKLSHQGAEVRALARVVYSSSDLGMGVAFTSVEREDERILEWWITELVSIPIR